MKNPHWKPRRLNELGFVGRGRSRHRPRNDPRLFGGPYPFIQTAEIMAADPYIRTYKQTYTDFGLAQSKIWSPDTLCITIAGANTAKTAILKLEACFPDSVVGFIPDQSRSNLFFVKYALDLMKEDFLAVTKGATQDNLSLDKLLSFPIIAPPVDIQNEIGAVLRTFDDLIDNNNRRVALLEEMARRIFDEWFVHFRAPDSKGQRLIKSPIGPIPEGWKVERLEDLASIVMGQSPKSSFYNQTGEGLPFHQGVTDFGEYFPTDRVYCSSISKVGEPGDVLVSVRAPVGRINIALNQLIIGRGLAAIRARKENHFYVLSQLRRFFRDEDQIGHGTIFRAIGKNDLGSIPVVVPPRETLHDFERIIRPYWSLIKTLTLANRNLRTQRNLLLPKLIFGEIDISVIAPISPKEAAE